MPSNRWSVPHWSEAPGLGRRVREAEALVLALDVDGTLAPIVPSPELARVPEATLQALAALARRPDVQAAVVSARKLLELRALVPIPHLLHAAEYGLVIAEGDTTETDPAAAQARTALEEAQRRLEARARGTPGAWVERKEAALTLHFRHVDPSEADRLLEAVEAALADLAEPAGPLKCQSARKALEVRPARGAHKGEILPRLLRRRPEALPVFVGDDTSDEDGFEAADRLGGFGIWIRSEEALGDETWARCYLRDPDEVRDWLVELAEMRGPP